MVHGATLRRIGASSLLPSTLAYTFTTALLFGHLLHKDTTTCMQFDIEPGRLEVTPCRIAHALVHSYVCLHMRRAMPLHFLKHERASSTARCCHVDCRTVTASADGTFDGTFEGTFDGTSEGTFDGTFEGTFDGTLEGTFDGAFDASVRPRVEWSVSCSN